MVGAGPEVDEPAGDGAVQQHHPLLVVGDERGFPGRVLDVEPGEAALHGRVGVARRMGQPDRQGDGVRPRIGDEADHHEKHQCQEALHDMKSQNTTPPMRNIAPVRPASRPIIADADP